MMIAFYTSLLLLYGCLFVFGLFGNGAVLFIVGRLFIHQRRFMQDRNRNIGAHLYYYVLALSTADLLVLSVIPTLIMEFWYQHWPWGTVMCKLHWATENINKIISISILTMLSIDRYLAVCHPLRFHWIRTGPAVLFVLSLLVAVAVMLMLPALIYSGVYMMPLGMNNDTLNSVRKCSLDVFMPETLFKAFVYYLVVCGFLIPGFLIIFCYTNVVCSIKKRFGSSILIRSRPSSRQNHKFSTTLLLTPLGVNKDESDESMCSQTPTDTCRVAIYRHRRQQHNRRKAYMSIVLTVIFHFACWTPFWLSTLVPLYHDDDEEVSQEMVMVMLFIHLLPYVNSSANWIFYVYMNKEIRKTVKQHRSRRSMRSQRETNF